MYVQEDQTRGNLSFNLVCAEMNVVNGNEKNSVFDGWIDEVANLFGGCNEKTLLYKREKMSLQQIVYDTKSERLK